jgi:hypothetical protein
MDEHESIPCPKCGGGRSIEGEDPNGIRCWTCTSCGAVVLDGARAEWHDGTYLAKTVRLFVEGDQIGAMIGKDLVQGVTGFGPSVHEALRDLADQLVENGIWIEVADPDNPLTSN